MLTLSMSFLEFQRIERCKLDILVKDIPKSQTNCSYFSMQKGDQWNTFTIFQTQARISPEDFKYDLYHIFVSSSPVAFNYLGHLEFLD